MQVGGARIDRIDQHLLQEAYNWRVFNLGCRLGGLLLARDIVRDVEFEVPRSHRLQRLGRACGRAFQGF